MARPDDPELTELLAQYVPVRVTNMRGVDLRTWLFDWDLTFAAVVAKSDGTILHRYGGRDHRGPDRFLGEESAANFLRAGLASFERSLLEGRENGGVASTFRELAVAPSLPDGPLALEGVPAFARRDRGECIHCHSVQPALREEAQRADSWSIDDLWIHPAPGRIGLDLHRNDPRIVSAVHEGSPAARAGIRVGMRLTSIGATPIATASDVMYALHRLGGGAQVVMVGIEAHDLRLRVTLEDGWKRASAEEFAWRPSKWGLTPAPGFGGPELGAAALEKVGLPAGTFAFRIQYLVTWGENRRFGEAARAAGLAKDTIVLGTTAKRDFESVPHFHAWWRLELEPGDEVEVVTWKGGREELVQLVAQE